MRRWRWRFDLGGKRSGDAITVSPPGAAGVVSPDNDMITYLMVVYAPRGPLLHRFSEKPEIPAQMS
jgi:hypothetical protein